MSTFVIGLVILALSVLVMKEVNEWGIGWIFSFVSSLLLVVVSFMCLESIPTAEDNEFDLLNKGDQREARLTLLPPVDGDGVGGDHE